MPTDERIAAGHRGRPDGDATRAEAVFESSLRTAASTPGDR
ncbi:hypothetical protein ACFR97_15510 [Haloplanus litoreus]|uniref:Uncharacterized protein n=1 Tax=Haloplanus litoreus TaxID=767515 RepID=A0ABD6A316_9EURY